MGSVENPGTTGGYNRGRTLTHELGHNFTYNHVFNANTCGTQYWNDIPPQTVNNRSAEIYEWPSGSGNFYGRYSEDSCISSSGKGDQFMNYMDYTDDACMNIFTQDQKNRMIAAINTSRAGLLTSNACNTDYGCTDSIAFNFDSLAIFNDGSCCYISGCTDPSSFNYDSLACYNDSSCVATVLGCTDPFAINYDPNANTSTAFGGALNNNIGSGGYFNGNQHLFFDASKPLPISTALTL